MATTKFKFIFANTDVKMEYEASNSMTVLEIKKWIIQEWSKDSSRPEPPETDGIRLICMGAAMDDRKTIQECKIPNYGQTIIPVNVSMLPKGQHYSNAPPKVDTPSKPKSVPSTTATSTNQSSNANSASASCCTIL